MNITQSALWKKLESFNIDEGDESTTFDKKLARENGWTLSYSRRVIQEYKRFVFLCAASGHPCSPSDEVDQAWHLHICYTRSYWDRMCGEVLEKPLHHNPSKGGSQEARKFEDWYGQTLRSYREVFGQEPPPDIWPPTEIRSNADERCKRIDTRSNWVIPKRPARILVGLLVLGSLAAGCSSAEAVFGLILLVAGGIGITAAIGALSSIGQTPAPRKRDAGASSGGCGGSSYGSSHGSSGGDCGGSNSGGDCGGSDGRGGGCGGGCGGGGD